ncbi:hypothetical protein [Pontibacter virosus]|uniref:hypothetical protein n=1 Tax=Pontibacter virosus TaxID=1765052 RepID=UPI001057C65A|nr:hypothetical protein [Pontibacter virosus]
MNFPSPNAASLGTYGEVPVSLFTGVPNIQIPLTELKDAGVSMPLSLSYHVASVRPNTRAGWVGLGWNLNVGGVITRTIRGYADEQKYRSQTNAPGIGFFDQYAWLNQDDWDQPHRLEAYYKAFSEFQGRESEYYKGPTYDIMADVFSFNFMGYSGKFMLGHDGKWKVVSDQDIKVEFNAATGFVNETTVLWRASKVATTTGFDIPDLMKNYRHRFFNEFTLITPDGTRYVFGGQQVQDGSDETVADATEFSVSYRGQNEEELVPTSWYLTKIIPASGTEVTFRYRPGPPVASIGNSIIDSSVSAERNGTSCHTNTFSGHGYTCVDGDPVSTTMGAADGFLILPVYLEKISSANYTVSFSISKSDELNYHEKDLKHTEDYYPFSRYLQRVSDLEWKKLESMSINGKDGQLIKRFSLAYYPSVDGDGKKRRLKLHKVTETGRDGKPSEPYVISYNETVKLPPYNVDAVDHWGYFNGADLCGMNNISIHTYHALRQPDGSGVYQRAETINRITFPTKGYTEFSFEPHAYYKVVDRDRVSFQQGYSNRKAGGLRIKEIKSYNYDGQLLAAKEFYYVKGFNGNENPDHLNSSGILGGLTQYAWDDYESKDIEGNHYTYSYFNSGSLLPFGLNGDGSHIGYSEVIERSVGNGFTRYTFSNFDTNSESSVPGGVELTSEYGDLSANGRTHYQTSFYSPYNDRSILRGKLLLRQDYDESAREVRKAIMHYEKSSREAVRMVEVRKQKLCSPVSGYYATAYQIPLYRFNLVKEELIEFNEKTPPFTSKKEYSYNASNLIREQALTDSKGQSQIVEYRYPGDYAFDGILNSYYADQVQWCAANDHVGHCKEVDRACYPYSSCEEFATAMTAELRSENNAATTLEKMQASHMLSPVVEELVWLQDANGRVLQSSVLNKFRDFGAAGGGIRLEEKLSAFVKEPIAASDFVQSVISSDFKLSHDSRYRREIYMKAYDDKGNLIEALPEYGPPLTYLWGYNAAYPTAEVKNATADQVFHTSFEATGTEGESAKTGNRFHSGDYTFSPPAGFSPLPGSTLSYWKWSATDNKWSLVKQLYNGGQVTCTGDRIDELRIVPPGAEMKTYTYNPLVGVTSMADTNGKTVYYEYDVLSRLKVVKDHAGNVLKSYEYHYRGQ